MESTISSCIRPSIRPDIREFLLPISLPAENEVNVSQSLQRQLPPVQRSLENVSR